MQKSAKIKIISAFALSAAAIAASAVLVFAFGKTSPVYSESGILEVLQSAVLVLCLAAFAAASWRSLKAPSGDGAAPLIPVFFTLLAYAFILREVDFDKMGLPAAAEFMLYGAGRHAVLIAGFAAIAVFAAARFGKYLKASLEFLKSSNGRFIAAAGALLVAGYLFEHEIPLKEGEFFEESCELMGYCSLFAAAASMCEKSGQNAVRA